MKELCLVSASGGLDSSLTLAMLKLAEYSNIIACHFKYGHRGQIPEFHAITNVCSKLQIPLKVFDIEQVVKSIDQVSMLTDPNAKITTGTAEGLKQLDAWVSGRNMIFMTLMAAFAEAQVMANGYDKVYFLGGFLNLTESGHYPDNSEYFLNSCLEMFKYGTLIGNRIKPLYGLSNLMKSDQFILIKEFNLYDVYQYTISCDRPQMKHVASDDTKLNSIPSDSYSVGIPCNCMKDGIPACGSGLLSYWASKLAGMDDMKIRNFYNVHDPGYKAWVPEHIKKEKILTKDVHTIIDRILFPPDKLEKLHKKVELVNE